MNLLYALFLGLWRRCFGSNGWNLPVIKNRFVQHIIGFLACFGILMYDGVSWWQSCLVGIVLQGLYWAKAVGMYQDIGNAGQPDEKMKKRYDEIWYNKFLDLWFKDFKYSDIYDFVGLCIRYTLPSILISIILFNVAFVFSGIFVSCSYAFMWKLQNYGYVKNPTEYAEFISGFITGLFLTL